MQMPRWKAPVWQKPVWLKRDNTVYIVGIALATLMLGLFAFVITPMAILKIVFVAVIATEARVARGNYFVRTETIVLEKRQTSLKTLPPRLKQRVQPFERHVTYWRKHPAALWFEGGILIPLAIGVVLGIAIGYASRSVAMGLFMIVFLTFVALALRAGFRHPEWNIRYYCVTTHRMIMTRGLITHSGPEVPLNKFLGREPIIPWHSHVLHKLGFIRELYGIFSEETAGRSEEMGKALDHITYIPNVWAVYAEVTAMQYKGKSTNDADDGT